MHPDRFYSEADLVRLLGLKVKYPGRALARAGIPSKKIGGQKYFAGRAILKFFGER